MRRVWGSAFVLLTAGLSAAASAQDLLARRTAGVFTFPDSPQPDPLNWSVAGPR